MMPKLVSIGRKSSSICYRSPTEEARRGFSQGLGHVDEWEVFARALRKHSRVGSDLDIVLIFFIVGKLCDHYNLLRDLAMNYGNFT